MEDHELLIEINERLKRIEKRQKEERTRRIIRIAVISLLVITLCIIVVPKAIEIYGAYKEMESKYNEVVKMVDDIGIKPEEIIKLKEKVEKIDFDKITKTVDSLGDIDFSSISDTLDNIKKIDFDSISMAVEKFKEFGSLFIGKS